MNRLQKFVEQGAKGEKPGRVAYVLRLESRPEADEGMTWQKVESFNAGDELLEYAGLKEVFSLAIKNGCALVTPR